MPTFTYSFTLADPVAKRRKMANVVMERFLKHNMFFVRFDPLLYDVLTPEFVEDLRQLVMVAKPGYKMMFIEPANAFLDTLLITEDPVEVFARHRENEYMTLGDQALHVDGFSWYIGDFYRYGGNDSDTITADGVVIPTGVTLTPAVRAARITGPSNVYEDTDYTLDYATGDVVPLTVWPVGSYTVDYSYTIVTSAGGEDPSLGDMPIIIGGQDHLLVRARNTTWNTGKIVLNALGTQVWFKDDHATFNANHEGLFVAIHGSANHTAYRILKVLSATTVLLDAVVTPTITKNNLSWDLQGAEGNDGAINDIDGVWYFTSPKGMFDARCLGGAIRYENPGTLRAEIEEVVDMNTVVLTGTFTELTDLHWKYESAQKQAGIVEHALTIVVRPVP